MRGSTMMDVMICQLGSTTVADALATGYRVG